MTEFLFLCTSLLDGKEIKHRLVYRAPTEQEAKIAGAEHLAGYGYEVQHMEKIR